VKEHVSTPGGIPGPPPLELIAGGLLKTGEIPSDPLQSFPHRIEKRFQGQERLLGRARGHSDHSSFVKGGVLIQGLIRINIDSFEGKASFGEAPNVSLQSGRCPVNPLESSPEAANSRLRKTLEVSGHRFTEQRAAVYRFICGTTTHPNADEVFQRVRSHVPGISLATVYKSLETLVNCGLAAKLTYSDGSARYDSRTDPHYHVRCLSCGLVRDIPGQLAAGAMGSLTQGLDGFLITGYRLELTGFCSHCSPHQDLEELVAPPN
jgi:Fe2+ or Zn2+ uptake regulation protein